MRSLKLPMTIEEFELAKIPFGWKDEYSNGFAYITPRDHGVLLKLEIERRELKTFAEIQPISVVNFEGLAELFYESFVDSVGIPQLDLCRAAILPDEKLKLAGACLVSKYKCGYRNEILFVRPKFQGKGIGTALVTTVLNELETLGEKIFWTEHHICDEQSANFYRKLGFVEETDIMTARFRRNFLWQEIRRYKHFGDLPKVTELENLLIKTEAEIVMLEKIEEIDFKAARLMWKYDY
jgi:GNAT superfamily N-acetyltransferase